MKTPLHWIPACGFLLSCILLVWTAQADAAQYIEHGDYQIHYSAFSSLLIPAEVAQAHGLKRGEREIVVNIAAIRSGHSAHVNVSGYVTNLLNQQVSLDFEEITESDAIYYLAGHTAMEADTLRFEITIRPPDVDEVVLRFVRRYD